MKRSEINQILREADSFIRSQGFFLPPFAYWSQAEWRAQGDAAQEIVEKGLGWDITDFGSGDFARVGLFLFTLRNGDIAALKQGKGKLYAEKLLIVDVGQVTPMHFHWLKTEDIINRGGGALVVKLANSDEREGLAAGDVRVRLDGVERIVPAGGTVTLQPGESITLEPYCYHEFWGEGARVLVGEVSTVNDDASDNRFLDGVGRFPTIDEDEEPLYLLVGDYARTGLVEKGA
ncbi:MAG: D-lyxose/D-mannose family sugar isomerase [Caldilineaceae bacterium]|nr:D-lyxose/D-mannose family sugar isomerase [Caldilineaceae bacterium]